MPEARRTAAPGRVKRAMALLKWLPARRGLRILMYHRVSQNHRDGLTVTRDQFCRQLDEILQDGYEVVSGGQVSKLLGSGDFGARPQVLLSFDDGSRSFMELAWPELKSRGLPAIMFLPVKFLGGYNEWDSDRDELLSKNEVQILAREGAEFALHGFAHINYRTSPPEAVVADLNKACEAMQELTIPWVKSLAYPYGAWPRESQAQFFKLMESCGLEWGLRIGNRLNVKPNSPFLLERFDVRGDHSPRFFSWQLQFGAGR